MSAKILVFPMKHPWVFVLRRPHIRQEAFFVVPYTIVIAPRWKEDDDACLAPFLASGWEPLFRSTDDHRRPIASELKPGDPINSLNHAINTFLSREERVELRMENVQLMYIAPHMELRRSS